MISITPDLVAEQERALAVLDQPLRFDVITRMRSVLIYGEHPHDYVASAYIFCYGDRGFMHQINGARFYEALRDNVLALLQECGVRTLEGYMTDAHARLLRIALRDRAKVDITGRGVCAGRDMAWVVVEGRPEKTDGVTGMATVVGA